MFVQRFKLAALRGAIAATLLATFVTAVPAANAAAECQATHVVQRGETLYRIGLKYNLTWDKIASVNGIKDPNDIKAGQSLCIPATSQPAPDVILVNGTDITGAMANVEVNIRVGPGTQYRVVGPLFAGQTARVTGVTPDGLWWRVPCPNGGNCFITARPEYTTGVIAGGGPVNPTPVPQPSKPATTPTLTVNSVVRDQTVTITASNLPADKTFDIRIGAAGTQGVGGTVVGSANSGKGGTFTTTVTIPAALRGSQQLAIRIDAKGGWFSYGWFYNR